MYTSIKMFATSLQGATKNCQFVALVPKSHGKTNVCVHRKSIKPWNLKKNEGGAFIVDDLYCEPMFIFFSAPPDWATAEYQISNRGFSDFLRPYYCDFLSNVYR